MKRHLWELEVTADSHQYFDAGHKKDSIVGMLSSFHDECSNTEDLLDRNHLIQTLVSWYCHNLWTQSSALFTHLQSLSHQLTWWMVAVSPVYTLHLHTLPDDDFRVRIFTAWENVSSPITSGGKVESSPYSPPLTNVTSSAAQGDGATVHIHL